MSVYVDLVFLLNLLINGAVLQTTAWTRRVSTGRLRIFAASAIGAAYAVLMLFPALSVLYTFLVKGLFSVLMIYVAFGFQSLQQFLRNIAAFYVVNFAVAGCMFALHYYFQGSSEVLNGILFTQSGAAVYTIKVGFMFIAAAGIAGFWLYRIVSEARISKERMVEFTAQVEVEFKQCKIGCIGLIDTGNQLSDPLSRLPVMVVEASLLSEHLPDSWMQCLRRGDTDALMQSLGQSDDEAEWSGLMRFVPYRGIGRGTQFMLAVKPEQVRITWNGGETATSKVLIGLDGGTLSSEGAYQAIIHPGLTEVNRGTA